MTFSIVILDIKKNTTKQKDGKKNIRNEMQREKIVNNRLVEASRTNSSLNAREYSNQQYYEWVFELSVIRRIALAMA